jgi:asparagine synthase (glutamine-hydrolysing)
MLVKVDQMSMANSLEVRVPFLDKRVVEWAFQLPPEMKIDKKQQKKIVKDTFKHLLPKDFFERKKQGFEVPLLNWLKADLSPLLDKYFEINFIEEQGLFNGSEIVKIREKLYSKHPGDATAKIWALLVFQHWYKNVFAN